MTRSARGRHAATASHARPRAPRPPRRLLAAGCVLAAAVLVIPAAATSASYRDDAFLHLDDMTSVFQIGAVHTASGTVHAVSPTGTSMTLAVPEGARGTYTPGTTASASVDVFNNSPGLDAQLDLTVAAAAAADTDEALAAAIRVSARAVHDDGHVEDLLGTPADPAASPVTLAEASAVLDRALAPRQADPLGDGDAFVAGAAGSGATVEVWLHLAPTAEIAGRQSGSPVLTITIGGSST
jgi:hypothetical protein